MKSRNITTTVLLPIIGFMFVISAVVFVRTHTTVTSAERHYWETVASHDRQEWRIRIAEQGERESFVADTVAYFSPSGALYRIVRDGRVVAEKDGFPGDIRERPDGFITARTDGRLTRGFSAVSSDGNLRIYILYPPADAPPFGELSRSTLSVFTLSCLLMILAVMGIIRKNLITPLQDFARRITRGEPVVPVNVKELDELFSVVNGALDTAKRKTLQADTLHNIAMSLNSSHNLDDLMTIIAEESANVLDAELSGVALYDEHGRFTKLKVHGISATEVGTAIGRMPKGRGILEFMRLSVTPVSINNISQHPAFSGAFPAGHPPITNFLGYPVFSPDGRPLGALYYANKRMGAFTAEDEAVLTAIASDVAVVLERATATSELEKFKRIIESAFDMVIITDPAGTIVYANPALERIAGYTPAEVLGRNPKIFNSGRHDEAFYSSLWNTILRGEPWKGEFVNKRKDGEIYQTSAVIFPLVSEDGEITNFISIQRDISEEKKLYEQLLRSQKMEAIGTLAGGIAHDFNNLLSAVIGYAELLLDDIDEDDPRRRHVAIIGESGRRGADLAARILSVSRKEKMEFTPVDLNAVVRDSLELLTHSIPKDITIKVRCNPQLPLINADPTQLHQVIMNLAVNARDAMPEGGVITMETARVGSEDGAAGDAPPSSGGFVKLGFSDTGKGMDDEITHKVFDPFFTTKDRTQGTGLGLYMVHSIVANHGGYINLYSEPGKGTRFNIYFPAAAGRGPATATEPEPSLDGKGTILIIDDESFVRELTTDVLGRFGYQVITAPDGRSGIETFREARDSIDLVLLDMIMPEMNGPEVFQVLKGIDPEVDVVVLSGYNSAGFAGIQELLSHGARTFVQKPFSKKALGRAVKDVMEKRRS